jgi:phospholipid N-methyltransferase
MDREKMSNLYRQLSIDVSYQVSVHLAKRFQRRRFLEIDQLETRIAYGSHIILVSDCSISKNLLL